MHLVPRLRRCILGAILLAATLGLVTAAPASAALVPSAAPASAAAPGVAGTEVFHTCKIIFTFHGVQAAQCADLFRVAGPDGFQFTAQNEIACQTTGGVERPCEMIQQRPEVAHSPPNAPGSTDVSAGPNTSCGVPGDAGVPPCPSTRFIHATGPLSIASGMHTCGVWAVSVATVIEFMGTDGVGAEIGVVNTATPHETVSC
jgi:hypothetical protein